MLHRSVMAFGLFVCLFSCVSQEGETVREANFCDDSEYTLYKDKASEVCYARKGTMAVTIPCITIERCSKPAAVEKIEPRNAESSY